MLLERLKPFQVDPNRVDRVEILKLVNKISSSSRVSEVQELFDRNISLCAYFFKNGYIKYREISFLSTSIITDAANRPDYICGCYHQKSGMTWYAIICAGPQEQTWNQDLELTPVAKRSFDKLNYCMNNLAGILKSNHLAETVAPESIHGLLVIGQDREFLKNPLKQDRKREINLNSPIKLRTYGAFIRTYRCKNQGWLLDTIDRIIAIFIQPKDS